MQSNNKEIIRNNKYNNYFVYKIYMSEKNSELG